MNVKSLSYRLVSNLCWHSGATSLLTRFASRHRMLAGGRHTVPKLQRRHGGSFQILVYHRISGDNDPFLPGTPVDVLERQFAVLKKHWNVVHLHDIVSRTARRDPIPPDTVAITFDDGYRDNYELAYPLLKKWNLPATIFLATSFIDQEDVPWNDKIAYALQRTRKPSVTFDHQGTTRHWALGSVPERLKARDEILWLLRHVLHEDKLRLLGEITSALGVTDFSPLRDTMLNWSQVREMQAGGVSFGAHTVTHAYLTRLPAKEARREVCGSKSRIEAAIDVPVTLFAYPAGTEADFNEVIRDIVRAAGFGAAVTTIFGFNDADTDLYALKRGGSAAQDPALFALQQAWYRLIN
jgi:peptidoglycan/xylan/chitin deacetylase (PgdA/CDA1 family)